MPLNFFKKLLRTLQPFFMPWLCFLLLSPVLLQQPFSFEPLRHSSSAPLILCTWWCLLLLQVDPWAFYLSTWSVCLISTYGSTWSVSTLRINLIRTIYRSSSRTPSTNAYLVCRRRRTNHRNNEHQHLHLHRS